MKKYFALFLLVSCCIGQTPVTTIKDTIQPSELEQAKLAKLKAQDETILVNMQNVDSQMQILSARKYILQQAEQQKKSELLGLAEQIKREHDWNTSITYDPNTGESGTFVKKEVKEPKK